MENNKLCTGLVGFGMAGKVFHAPLLHCCKLIDLKYVVERNNNLSKETYKYVELVKSLEDLLSK